MSRRSMQTTRPSCTRSVSGNIRRGVNPLTNLETDLDTRICLFAHRCRRHLPDASVACRNGFATTAVLHFVACMMLQPYVSFCSKDTAIAKLGHRHRGCRRVDTNELRACQVHCLRREPWAAGGPWEGFGYRRLCGGEPKPGNCQVPGRAVPHCFPPKHS
jgi:hypothetical protein